MACRSFANGLAVAAVCALATVADAQTPPTQAPYRPGLGDLMTNTVQPRHIKLWAGGAQRNWAYAAYELHELEEAFERAGRAWPKWRSYQVPEMIDALTKPPLGALDAAIKAADPTRFAAAFAELTEACNACHKAADRGVIVIRVPEAAGFPDQDFRPANP